MVRERLSGGVALLAAIILVGALASRVAVPFPIAFAAPALAGTPDDQLTVAADTLEAATAKDGPGYSFTIVSRSTLDAKAGGPLIEIPDPADRTMSLGETDTYELGSMLERGFVTPDGFWMEMREGPADPATTPDFATAPYAFGALVRDGKTFRNDGAGWYETDRPPGIGLDPATAALLPTLLRNATDAAAKGTDTHEDEFLAKVEAMGAVSDVPGIVAVDGEAFTELTEPIAFGLDEQGRLRKLTAIARNTNIEAWDLVITTTIVFDYDTPTGPLPEPEPRWEPDKADAETPS